MATWSGWQLEFLTAARIRNTPPNQQFLTDWAAHANSPSCRRNPIDLHAKVGGSGNCVKPAGFSWWTQHYATHADAAEAFSRQVNALEFGAILDTLGSGNPFDDPGYKQVATALDKWGSTNFAAWYLAQTQPTTGGDSGAATGIHKGWHDLQRSLGKQRLRAAIDSS